MQLVAYRQQVAEAEAASAQQTQRQAADKPGDLLRRVGVPEHWLGATFETCTDIPAQLVEDDLQARDVRLAARDGRLAYDAPAGVLTPDMRAALVARKAEVLALLASDWYAAALALPDRVRDPDRRADLRYEFEERAGIAEYDGNLPRPEAEQVAYLQMTTAKPDLTKVDAN